MAQCHAFSECSGPYYVPGRGRGWPMLLVSDDSPASDSLQPCGPPKQRFLGESEVGPDFDEPCPPGFRQSKCGVTSTEFPARRSSPLAPTFCAPVFLPWPPNGVVGRR